MLSIEPHIDRLNFVFVIQKKEIINRESTKANTQSLSAVLSRGEGSVVLLF